MRKILISCNNKYNLKPLGQYAELGLMVKSASIWQNNMFIAVNHLLPRVFISFI